MCRTEPNEIDKPYKREIRSFVIRDGRITPGQIKALEEYWPLYGYDLNELPLDQSLPYLTEQPVVLEIGFGMGDSLFEMATKAPETNFIGVEVHRPGVGHLLSLVRRDNLQNVRVFKVDSIDVLKQALPDSSLDKVQIFFPDPWHKKKHNKRRLITSSFIALVQAKLKDGGLLHIATDWEPYAEEISELMDSSAGFNKGEVPERVVTKYEKRGLRLGHKVTDLAYVFSSIDELKSGLFE
jgi:tRNA (guanine-N7-)-methyltransferase